MASIRFRHNSAGYRQVMKSKGVQDDLQRRADRVRQAAEPQYEGEELWDTEMVVIADTYVGRSRAGATVLGWHPRSMAIERKRRVLGGAIDAAGG